MLTYLNLKGHTIYNLLSDGSEKKSVCVYLCMCGDRKNNDKANVVNISIWHV